MVVGRLPTIKDNKWQAIKNIYFSFNALLMLLFVLFACARSLYSCIGGGDLPAMKVFYSFLLLVLDSLPVIA